MCQELFYSYKKIVFIVVLGFFRSYILTLMTQTEREEHVSLQLNHLISVKKLFGLFKQESDEFLSP